MDKEPTVKVYDWFSGKLVMGNTKSSFKLHKDPRIHFNVCSSEVTFSPETNELIFDTSMYYANNTPHVNVFFDFVHFMVTEQNVVMINYTVTNKGTVKEKEPLKSATTSVKKTIYFDKKNLIKKNTIVFTYAKANLGNPNGYVILSTEMYSNPISVVFSNG